MDSGNGDAVMSGETHVRNRLSVLYRDPCLSDEDVLMLAETRGEVFNAQARGLCSRIYRLPDGTVHGTTMEGCREKPSICIKRVVEEDQVAPHAVEREVLSYSLMWEALRATQEDHHIMHLLGAFRDDSDPFSVTWDLVMPWYPCTLQDVLDEPSMQINVFDDPGLGSDEQDTDTSRPSRGIVRMARSHCALALSTISALFSALSFLHSVGIAHRDIKPSNILIRPEDASAQLIDFGTCFLSGERYVPGDDGRGGVASEVGTGAYRAPESLLSPLRGYDVYKVDMWQAGTTLVEFFLPLRRVAVEKPNAAKEAQAESRERFELIDDRLEWERALWTNDDGKAWSELQSRFDEIEGHKSDFFTAPYGEEDDDEPQVETSVTGWRRETLFDGTRGDLGLANSIFDLCGLPTATPEGEAEWPEAVAFQPSLAKLPFARREAAKGGLRTRLINVPQEPGIQTAIDVLDGCIRLSASNRLSAEEAATKMARSIGRPCNGINTPL